MRVAKSIHHPSEKSGLPSTASRENIPQDQSRATCLKQQSLQNTQTKKETQWNTSKIQINRNPSPNPSPNPWVSQTHHVHPTPRLRSRSSPKGNKILVSLCIKTCNYHVSHVDHNTKYVILLWLMCKSEKHRIVYSDSKEKHIVSYSQNSVFQNVVNQFPSKTNDQPFQISSANWQTFCAYSVPTPSSWCNQIHRHPNW